MKIKGKLFQYSVVKLYFHKIMLLTVALCMYITGIMSKFIAHYVAGIS